MLRKSFCQTKTQVTCYLSNRFPLILQKIVYFYVINCLVNVEGIHMPSELAVVDRRE